MIPNDLVKQAIVAYLKASSSLIAQLPDGTKGVREQYWRGTDFSYPNVRVELETQVDSSPNVDCNPALQDWSVHVFSQKQSSQEADDIAGIIMAYLRGSSFTQNTVKFQKVSVTENIPAIPEDEHTWRSQIRCRSVVYVV